MIQLTEKARSRLRKIMGEKGKHDHGLRMAIREGGCFGLSYFLELQKEPTPEDCVLEFEGVRIFVDLSSAIYLQNLVLDYSDSWNGSGFTFQNSIARRTCGCGQSFSL